MKDLAIAQNKIHSKYRVNRTAVKSGRMDYNKDIESPIMKRHSIMFKEGDLISGTDPILPSYEDQPVAFYNEHAGLMLEATSKLAQELGYQYLINNKYLNVTVANVTKVVRNGVVIYQRKS